MPEEIITPNPDDGGTGSTSVRCLQKTQADKTIKFCSDFDDVADPFAGWNRPDDPASYVVEPAPAGQSLPNVALLRITGGKGSSPDTRVRRTLPSATQVSVSGSMKLSTPNATNAIIFRFAFASSAGSLLLRSSGAVVETVPTTTGYETERLLEPTPLPTEWTTFTFNVDLVGRAFSFDMNGEIRHGMLTTSRPAGAVTVVLGAAEPNDDVAPDLTVLLDDIVMKTN